MASSSSPDIFGNISEAILSGNIAPTTENLTRLFEEAYNADETGFKENFRKSLLKAYGGDENNLSEEMARSGHFRGPGGVSGLHACAMQGFTSTCKHLIENSIFDVNMEDDTGATALHFAVKEEYPETAAYLIEKGADLNKTDEKGFTPLHVAAVNGCIEMMRLLISKGADLNHSDSNSQMGTPLHSAVATNEKEAMRVLLELGANPNSTLGGFLTPLYLSIMFNSLESMKLLLEAGADPNICVCGSSPLGHAATMGLSEIVKCLLDAGSNPNHIDAYGYTPFENAVHHGHLECVMILFPITPRLSSFAQWNLTVILLQLRSNEFRVQRDLIMKEVFKKNKAEGDNAFRRKEFYHAMAWYTQAMSRYPTDASVWSNRSLCWANLNYGSRALSDAEACVRLRPDWPKAHYREAVAWKLLKNYPKAMEAFYRALKLNPNNKQIQKALQSVIEEQQSQGTANSAYNMFPFSLP